ncbi:hypothetical protein PHSY_002256 [Pseudozyma hubeiensis SY62]|uniref:Uncharacterized protein n=1 Tax=Pseudozyma hubeiensis (strain SY62) TaxID=1305764 RepID=R9P0F8_PSEHS|nr:hypothetical protein PHSY_002256 [Pseudozyma hubeiensis SY62]GAC94683.1 hypothetical protein PHSY_002256 [Pseudozyma hubeiensis SY62]
MRDTKFSHPKLCSVSLDARSQIGRKTLSSHVTRHCVIFIFNEKKRGDTAWCRSDTPATSKVSWCRAFRLRDITSIVSMKRHESQEACQAEPSLPSSFDVTSHLGVHLYVSWFDLPHPSIHDKTTTIVQAADVGDQFVVTATIMAPDSKTLAVDDPSLLAMVKPMTEDIRNRRFRVHLEWKDLRTGRAVPLRELFVLTTLPLLLRDLVSQATSRLMFETLLRDTPTAKVYHRSWQHRQRDIVPLISSIATSMRSLITHASQSDQLDPVLQQLGLSQSLPSVIILVNFLTKLDMDYHPPSKTHLPAASRARSNRKPGGHTDVPAVVFAPDQDDDAFGWIDNLPAQQSTRSHQAEHDDNSSQVCFAPDDDDQDQEDTHLCWSEILRFSQE